MKVSTIAIGVVLAIAMFTLPVAAVESVAPVGAASAEGITGCVTGGYCALPDPIDCVREGPLC